MTIHKRTAGSQGRQQRQHDPDRRMQSRELFVPAKWQVEVRALQIGPTVPRAVEKPVKLAIDFGALSRPQA